ncbi:MAG: DUF4214 domain-containing protein [Candidatus Caenarcaniphilales bacterium]|nr:DUF4214 domain-containing protein [Candidatus Caenarcaniphilales bacterium]
MVSFNVGNAWERLQSSVAKNQELLDALDEVDESVNSDLATEYRNHNSSDLIESARERFLNGDISADELTNALNTEYSEFTVSGSISDDSSNTTTSNDQEYTLVEERDGTIKRVYLDGTEEVIVNADGNRVADGTGNTQANNNAGAQAETNNPPVQAEAPAAQNTPVQAENTAPPPAQTNSIVDQNSETIKNIYRDVLDREMVEGDGTYWQEKLDSGTSAQDIKEAMFYSDEFRNNAFQSGDPVKHLYENVLGREMTEGDGTYWQDKFNGGKPLEEIIDAFLESDEYKAKNP